MTLDAIIVSDTGFDSYSGSSPLRLEIDGRTALIQTVRNYLKHRGKIVPPIEGDHDMNWASAPRLNGIYLFDYLRRQGFEVGLVHRFDDQKEAFCNLLEEKPRAVVVSTTFILTKQALRRLAREIRTLAPDVPIIVGGAFVYSSFLLLQRSEDPTYETRLASGDYLFLAVDEEPPVDLYIVSQGGEQTLCEALRRVKEGRGVEDLPNSARLVGDRYAFATRIDDVTPSQTGFVDWESLPDSLFVSGVVPMQASNGCPYRCAFCNFIKDRRRMFVKPIEELVAEMKAVSRRGVKYVRFVDDNFRLGMDDLNAVCQRFVEEEIDVRWMSFIRASTLEKVDFELLRRAGCIEVQLGLESADPGVLRNMNKKADPKRYADVIRNLFSVGINCSCCFIVGFPGETEETVQRTVEFIENVAYPDLDGLLSWNLFPFLLAPLSPVYEPEMRSRYGLEGYMHDWRHRTMDARQAREAIEKAFFKIERSGSVYRGDNLDLLLSLSPASRKRFVTVRHRLSKLAARGELDQTALHEGFGDIFLGVDAS